MIPRAEHAMQAASDAAGQYAQHVTVTGASAAGLGWLLDSAVLSALGVLLAAIGTAATVYYRRRDDRRAQEMHEAKLARLKRGLDTDTADLPHDDGHHAGER